MQDGSITSIRNFNPRSREGSDNNFRKSGRKECNFNPRSREGSDSPRKTLVSYAALFQSTLPRRERQAL